MGGGHPLEPPDSILELFTGMTSTQQRLGGHAVSARRQGLHELLGSHVSDWIGAVTGGEQPGFVQDDGRARWRGVADLAGLSQAKHELTQRGQTHLLQTVKGRQVLPSRLVVGGGLGREIGDLGHTEGGEQKGVAFA